MCCAALSAATAMPSCPPALLPLCRAPPRDPLVAQHLAQHAAPLYALALRSGLVSPEELASGLVTLLSDTLVPADARVTGLAAVGAVARALSGESIAAVQLHGLLERLASEQLCWEVRAAALEAVPGLLATGAASPRGGCSLLLHGMQVHHSMPLGASLHHSHTHTHTVSPLRTLCQPCSWLRSGHWHMCWGQLPWAVCSVERWLLRCAAHRSRWTAVTGAFNAHWRAALAGAVACG